MITPAEVTELAQIAAKHDPGIPARIAFAQLAYMKAYRKQGKSEDWIKSWLRKWRSTGQYYSTTTKQE